MKLSWMSYLPRVYNLYVNASLCVIYVHVYVYVCMCVCVCVCVCVCMYAMCMYVCACMYYIPAGAIIRVEALTRPLTRPRESESQIQQAATHAHTRTRAHAHTHVHAHTQSESGGGERRGEGGKRERERERERERVHIVGNNEVVVDTVHLGLVRRRAWTDEKVPVSNDWQDDWRDTESYCSGEVTVQHIRDVGRAVPAVHRAFGVRPLGLR